MPTPIAPTTETAEASGGFALAGAAPALSGRALSLPGSNTPWTLMVSPASLQCVSGHIVPRFAKARHEPGDNGNAPGPNRGEGAETALRARGYQAVPHDMTGLRAFGEPIVGGVSCYLTAHRGVDPAGRPCVFYTDRWTRPRQIGATVRWETDHAGRLEFMRRCLALMMPGGPEPIHIEIATEALIDKARRHLQFDAGAARDRILSQIAANLPREHAPAGLIPFYPEPPTEPPTKGKGSTR